MIKGDILDTCLEKLSLRYKDISLMMKVPKRASHLQGMKILILGKKKLYTAVEAGPTLTLK